MLTHLKDSSGDGNGRALRPTTIQCNNRLLGRLSGLSVGRFGLLVTCSGDHD